MNPRFTDIHMHMNMDTYINLFKTQNVLHLWNKDLWNKGCSTFVILGSIILRFPYILQYKLISSNLSLNTISMSKITCFLWIESIWPRHLCIVLFHASLVWWNHQQDTTVHLIFTWSVIKTHACLKYSYSN